MINKRGVITLLDSEGLEVRRDGYILGINELETRSLRLRKPFKGPATAPLKCKGLYCDYRKVFENAMIDEKDELNNLYIMESDIPKTFEIEYKSIVLDLVERLKTSERVAFALEGQTTPKVNQLADGLLFRFRKYYAIADLKKFELFKHIHYIHLYHKK